MAKIKADYKPAQPLTEWLSYELASSEMLDPPVLRLRLRALDRYDVIDATIDQGDLRAGRTIAAAALMAVVEWDLEGPDGKPIPVTDTTKDLYLKPLVGEELKLKPGATAPGYLLGIQIVKDARNRSLFLKN